MNVMASLCLSPSSCSSYLGAEDVWVGLFSECVVGSQVKLVIKSSRELGFGRGRVEGEVCVRRRGLPFYLGTCPSRAAIVPLSSSPPAPPPPPPPRVTSCSRWFHPGQGLLKKEFGKDPEGGQILGTWNLATKCHGCVTLSWGHEGPQSHSLWSWTCSPETAHPLGAVAPRWEEGSGARAVEEARASNTLRGRPGEGLKGRPAPFQPRPAGAPSNRPSSSCKTTGGGDPRSEEEAAEEEAPPKPPSLPPGSPLPPARPGGVRPARGGGRGLGDSGDWPGAPPPPPRPPPSARDLASAAPGSAPAPLRAPPAAPAPSRPTCCSRPAAFCKLPRSEPPAGG